MDLDQTSRENMSEITTRLRTLQAKATEKGQWPLVCALAATLNDESNLDYRINAVGAMHEVALLRNSLQPFWAAWRSDTDALAWAHRCIERLIASDHDYWAVAALLGLPLAVLRTSLVHFRFRLVSIRYAQPYKDNKHHIAALCLNRSDTVISPVLEVGWDTVTAEVVDMSRWRAVILQQQTIQRGNLIGHGSGSYFLRANLPYGGWRLVASEFRFLAEWSVPHEQTLLADYR
jgi:hypothetical protein